MFSKSKKRQVAAVVDDGVAEPYRYALAMDKSLSDFNMEAQGDLLADYFVLRFLGSAAAMRQPRHGAGLALFEAVLARFLADPGDIKNLPKSILNRLR